MKTTTIVGFLFIILALGAPAMADTITQTVTWDGDPTFWSVMKNINQFNQAADPLGRTLFSVQISFSGSTWGTSTLTNTTNKAKNGVQSNIGSNISLYDPVGTLIVDLFPSANFTNNLPAAVGAKATNTIAAGSALTANGAFGYTGADLAMFRGAGTVGFTAEGNNTSSMTATSGVNFSSGTSAGATLTVTYTVPDHEPSIILLLASGVVGLVVMRKRSLAAGISG